jgi:membrane associated rhomboid family serine protease
MGKTALVLVGAAMAIAGLVWTLQGLGMLEGSPMSGVAFWAKVGPAVSGLGVALVIVALRRRR